MYYKLNKTRNLTREQKCVHQWGSSDAEFVAALVHAIALTTIQRTRQIMHTTWECIFVKKSPLQLHLISFNKDAGAGSFCIKQCFVIVFCEESRHTVLGEELAYFHSTPA